MEEKKQFIVDYHIHTTYSGDVPPECGGSVRELCTLAIERGLGEIAFTDHKEMDGEYYGIFRPLDLDGLCRDISAAREEFSGRLEILFGLELAQAVHMPKEARRLVGRYPFDFVLGSVHAVRGIIDFFYLEMDKMSDGELLALWNSYRTELRELVEWGDFDSLAHITYPYRYFKRAGRESLLQLESRGREYFEDILKEIIQKGISLEVNASGLRQGLGETLPSDDLLLFYKELGGARITVGSDCHNKTDLASGVAQTISHLKQLGFTHLTRYKNRKPYTLEI